MSPVSEVARRVVLETIGWLLVLVGVAALILPGPGLLMLFGGLAILSQQYEWADRRVRPIELKAKRAAADSVQTWPRIVLSLLGVCWLAGVGLVWVIRPEVPDWWPARDSLWLLGGWPTGVTLIASAFIALAMIVYSFRHYRGMDEAERDAHIGADD